MAHLKSLISFLALFFVCFSGTTQTTFAKLYTSTGYDYGRDVIESFQDSGLVITGSSGSFISETADMLLLKTDSLGNFEWSTVFGGSDSDWGNKIIQTRDTGYAIAGYTNSKGAGGFDFFVVKTDQYGQKLWDTTFGGADWDIAHSILELPSKDLVIVGETQSFGNGGKDGYMICLDSAGNFKWEKTYGGATDDVFYDVDFKTDSLWIVGSKTSHNADTNSDAWIVNFDMAMVDTNYTDTLGGPGDDVFYAVDINSANIYFAGSYYSSSTKKDGWLYIYNYISSTLINNKIYNMLSEDDTFFAQDIEPTTSTPFQTGYTKSIGYAVIDSKKDFNLNKTTYNGAYINYNSSWGEKGEDIGYGVQITYDKAHVYVGDMQYNSTGGNGILIVKLKGDGDYVDINDLQNMQITTSINQTKSRLIKSNIYPNPTSGDCTIKSKKIIKSISLFDMTGKLIKNKKVNTRQVNMNLNNIEGGTYIIQLTGKNGNISSKKLIIY